jgi:hypothetical protein
MPELLCPSSKSRVSAAARFCRMRWTSLNTAAIHAEAVATIILGRVYLENCHPIDSRAWHDPVARLRRTPWHEAVKLDQSDIPVAA